MILEKGNGFAVGKEKRDWIFLKIKDTQLKVWDLKKAQCFFEKMNCFFFPLMNSPFTWNVPG
ncbi:hypothetical protein J437_LFUL015131 [Ladona fulva]|uniref:Uncharacterized protein n=1 Tax=Ladona fulva TaxID=123851 RepID=A0A8K0KFT9_LADFU|nr:hypothetical protein J437_LFUL015131 [Ladona fulva]